MNDIAFEAADPRTGDGAVLTGELIAYVTELYPEDAEDPPSPWGPADLARAFLVARVEGEAAACGGLVDQAEPDVLEVVRMYVRPGFRGHGLAGRVLAELEAAARARGARRLRLRCGPRQPDALRLYAKAGYTPRGPFAQHREHPTNIFLEKAL